MVDAVVSVFVEELLNTLSDESRILSEFNRNKFEELGRELQLMQGFLKDADRIKRKNETLRRIMGDLRELIDRAEDILADCRLHASGFSLLGLYPSKLPFQYRTGKQLREINRKIIKIKGDISALLRVPSMPQPESGDTHNQQFPRWSSPVYDHTQVVGLESDTEKIKNWLLEADQGILAIGFVGMGGVGKTTTAQEVFNSRQMEARFDRRMWVSVSQTFTEELIMRSMLRSLGDPSLGDDRAELLKKINQYLQGKRYLLVMDDVWSLNNSWWLKIHEGLPRGNGSCVIITTRNEKVAQLMGVTDRFTHRPKLLSTDNSWLLFRKIAFAATGGDCVYPELENIGKEIVEKCKGLPLAIKAVGGMMLCKPPYFHEWRRILDHFRDELEESSDSVMASLQLSYDELPPYLKSCFLCLSLYPEDCVIPKEQLVYWWIGEGFVPLRLGRVWIESGEDCFTGLTNRCLMEVVDKSYNGTIFTCKIHDMVRDLAIKIAKEDVFSGTEGLNCRRLAITSNGRDQKNPSTTSRNLRALISTTKMGEVNKVGSSTAMKLCKNRFLRVLDLSKSIFDSPLASLLNEIGSIKHLAFVSLSSTHPLIELPSSLQALSYCQILDLSYCQSLKRIPIFVTNFEKLMVLDVSHCGSLEFLPNGLGKLSNLQVLLGFRPAKPNQPGGSRISELKSLIRLRTLGLELTQGDEIADSELDSLIGLLELQFLTISCFDGHGSDLIEKLHKLSPPKNLHELCLKFYPGNTSPEWLNPIALPMLRYLSICSGNIRNMEEGFWGGDENAKWKIEGLMLEAVSELRAEWSAVIGAMPRLRIVSACWCPQLRDFPIEDVGFKGDTWKMEKQSR